LVLKRVVRILWLRKLSWERTEKRSVRFSCVTVRCDARRWSLSVLPYMARINTPLHVLGSPLEVVLHDVVVVLVLVF